MAHAMKPDIPRPEEVQFFRTYAGELKESIQSGYLRNSFHILISLCGDTHWLTGNVRNRHTIRNLIIPHKLLILPHGEQ